MSMVLPQDTKWPYMPGVLEHCERTGERPPECWNASPADLVAHGGYAVACASERAPACTPLIVLATGADAVAVGPYAWVENAAAAAGRHGGRVVSWRWATKQSARERLRRDAAARRWKEVLA